MTPNEAISFLDRTLALHGEDVIIQRAVGTATVDVQCRAAISAISLQELSPGVAETDQHMVISMTQIRARGWPNQHIRDRSPYDPDPQLPTLADNVIIQGRVRNIAFVDARRIDDVIVRVNIRLTG